MDLVPDTLAAPKEAAACETAHYQTQASHDRRDSDGEGAVAAVDSVLVGGVVGVGRLLAVVDVAVVGRACVREVVGVLQRVARSVVRSRQLSVLQSHMVTQMQHLP